MIWRHFGDVQRNAGAKHARPILPVYRVGIANFANNICKLFNVVRVSVERLAAIFPAELAVKDAI